MPWLILSFSFSPPPPLTLASHPPPPGASDASTTVKYSFVSYNANNPCEDTFSIAAKTDRSVPFKTACAVFDGHGGRQVAKYAENNFLKYFFGAHRTKDMTKNAKRSGRYCSNLKISAKFRQTFCKISAFFIKIYGFSSFFR